MTGGNTQVCFMQGLSLVKTSWFLAASQISLCYVNLSKKMNVFFNSVSAASDFCCAVSLSLERNLSYESINQTCAPPQDTILLIFVTFLHVAINRDKFILAYILT